MPYIPARYTASDLAREDEIEFTEAAMMEDDERTEQYDLERDQEDGEYQPSSQETDSYNGSCPSSQSSSHISEDDSATIRGARIRDSGDQPMEEDYAERDGEDEDGFPRRLFEGGALRQLALARKAWFRETGPPVARFLAAARVFTGLSREQVNAAYSIILQNDFLIDANDLQESDDMEILQIAREQWGAAIRR